MADPPRNPDTGNATGVRRDGESTTSTPRWVKVFGIIAIVVVLLFVILLLTGRGHGPGRHTPPGEPDAHTLPSSVTEHGVEQP